MQALKKEWEAEAQTQLTAENTVLQEQVQQMQVEMTVEAELSRQERTQLMHCRREAAQSVAEHAVLQEQVEQMTREAERTLQEMREQVQSQMEAAAQEHADDKERLRTEHCASIEQLQCTLEAAKNDIVVIKTRSTSLQQAVHYDVLQEALLHKTAQLTDLEGRSQRQLQELRTDHQLTQQQLAQCERDHEEQREELDRVRTDLLEQQISQELQQTELDWLAGQHVDLEASTELLRTASSAVSAGETHDESADDMVVLEQECVVPELEQAVALLEYELLVGNDALVASEAEREEAQEATRTALARLERALAASKEEQGAHQQELEELHTEHRTLQERVDVAETRCQQQESDLTSARETITALQDSHAVEMEERNEKCVQEKSKIRDQAQQV